MGGLVELLSSSVSLKHDLHTCELIATMTLRIHAGAEYKPPTCSKAWLDPPHFHATELDYNLGPSWWKAS